MLNILYASSSSALEAFRAASNPVDEELVELLEAMVARTRDELYRQNARFANPA